MAQSLEGILSEVRSQMKNYIDDLSYAPVTEVAILCDIFASQEDINFGYHFEDFQRESNLAANLDEIFTQVAALDLLMEKWPEVRKFFIKGDTVGE